MLSPAEERRERKTHTHTHTHTLTQTHILNNNLLLFPVFFFPAFLLTALCILSHCVRLNGSGAQAVMNLRSQYTCTSLATNITGEPPVFQDTLPSLIWCLNDNEHSHDNLYHLVLNTNLKKERKRCMFAHTVQEQRQHLKAI